MKPAPGQDVVTLLQSLVQIPSVNPLANPAPGEGGEKRCAEAVAEYLAALGAQDIALPEVLPDRPNVLARMPTDRPGKPREEAARALDRYERRWLRLGRRRFGRRRFGHHRHQGHDVGHAACGLGAA